nr:ATP-dependent Clp protease adapter ClpS [Zoogloea sp.]
MLRHNIKAADKCLVFVSFPTKPDISTRLLPRLRRTMRRQARRFDRPRQVRQVTLAQSSGLFRMGRMVIKKQEESVLETSVTRVKPPPLFKVMLLNDDFTPMDFVVAVIEKYFGKDREQATRIMLKVHREGVGVCGVFPRDIAATKVEQVIAYARQYQHPLACVMEEN